MSLLACRNCPALKEEASLSLTQKMSLLPEGCKQSVLGSAHWLNASTTRLQGSCRKQQLFLGFAPLHGAKAWDLFLPSPSTNGLLRANSHVTSSADTPSPQRPRGPHSSSPRLPTLRLLLLHHPHLNYLFLCLSLGHNSSGTVPARSLARGRPQLVWVQGGQEWQMQTKAAEQPVGTHLVSLAFCPWHT